MQTNYERYFGTPAKAADSISRLVDHYDVEHRTGGEGEQFRSEFTDHFRIGGDCEYGLMHDETLAMWLEAPWDGWVLDKVNNYTEAGPWKDLYKVIKDSIGEDPFGSLKEDEKVLNDPH